MTFKRIQFEAIPVESQNHWEVPDKMTKHTKKCFEKYVSDKELKNNITLNSPEPTNLPKAKTMDDYFVELEESEKEKENLAGRYFKEVTDKNTNNHRTPLQSVEESLTGNLMLTRCCNKLIKPYC